jgi:UPF0271 protein
VIEDPLEVVAQARAIARGRPVAAMGGTAINLKADTLCLHGEGAGAAELARLLIGALQELE